jgi:hypothetical protein
MRNINQSVHPLNSASAVEGVRRSAGLCAVRKISALAVTVQSKFHAGMINLVTQSSVILSRSAVLLMGEGYENFAALVTETVAAPVFVVKRAPCAMYSADTGIATHIE